jgi:hypothetical protein
LETGIEIIKQIPVGGNERTNTVFILGKDFSIAPSSEKFRVIMHHHYPMVDENDLRDFISYSLGRNTIVISGSQAKVHPYRLMFIEEEGLDAHLFDVPQSVRGNRHAYPQVYQFVPALIALPPHVPASHLQHLDKADLYVMPQEKLLDESILLDRLLIQSFRKASSY